MKLPVPNPVAELAHTAHGAQLLQACVQTPAGLAPLFYNSPISSPGAPARAGVPILFPQFADIGPLPKHGWVRNLPWQPMACPAEGVPVGANSFAYQLHLSATDRADWPHACVLQLHVQSSAQQLLIRLKVINTGDATFTWTGGLHPYWLLEDLPGASVSGLTGIAVRDRYCPGLCQQEADTLTLNGQPFERLYCACPAVCLHTGAHVLELTAAGFSDWMVWNPGASGATALRDLPDDDWRKFICIEPVCVSKPVVLAPGAEFEGELKVIARCV